VLFHGENVYATMWTRFRSADTSACLSEAKPVPKSIYENVAWGARHQRVSRHLDSLVEHSLRQAACGDEVKDKLHRAAYPSPPGSSSALYPRASPSSRDIILMDEPRFPSGPDRTLKIEELMRELPGTIRSIVVTHNMQQAGARCRTIRPFQHGRGTKRDTWSSTGRPAAFTNPRHQRTEDYITGRFG